MLYNVPAKEVTAADGSCGNTTDSITLQWKTNNITLEFLKNATVNRFELAQLQLTLNASSLFDDAKGNAGFVHL